METRSVIEFQGILGVEEMLTSIVYKLYRQFTILDNLLEIPL